jgi:hypothetical protein
MDHLLFFEFQPTNPSGSKVTHVEHAWNKPYLLHDQKGSKKIQPEGTENV